MTTFAYQPTFRDGEVIALKAAILHYMEYCDKMTQDGEEAPYSAHMTSLAIAFAKLMAPAGMASVFIPPRGRGGDQG